MAYVDPNFKSKKALRDAVKAGQAVYVFSPGPWPFPAKQEGEETIAGPHYPQPHRWYARVRVQSGRVVAVLS